MKREVLCEKHGAPDPQTFPGEGWKKVTGKALHQFRCDVCNFHVKPGEPIVALSLYALGEYFEWESYYLRPEESKQAEGYPIEPSASCTP